MLNALLFKKLEEKSFFIEMYYQISRNALQMSQLVIIPFILNSQ